MGVKVPLTIMHLLKVVIKLSFPLAKYFDLYRRIVKMYCLLLKGRSEQISYLQIWWWHFFFILFCSSWCFEGSSIDDGLIAGSQSSKILLRQNEPISFHKSHSSLESSEIWAGCKENILSHNFVTRSLGFCDEYLRIFEWIESPPVKKNYRMVCRM